MAERGGEMKYNTILFDFDYTLADATPGIVESALFALHEMGFPAPDVEAVRRTVGMSLPESLSYLTGVTEAAQCKRYAALFVQKADEVMTPSTVLFDGTIDVLTRLRTEGARIGIVTSKFRYRIEQALAKFSAEHLVDIVIGYEDVSAPKPSPEGIDKALAHLGAKKEQALFVGDSLYDANAAANAGIDFAAILNGTTEQAAFEPLPHVLIADSLTALCRELCMKA